MAIQDKISSMLKDIGEVPEDWQNMTLRDIFSELDRVPGYVVCWGCWSESELDTVFLGV